MSRNTNVPLLRFMVYGQGRSVIFRIEAISERKTIQSLEGKLVNYIQLHRKNTNIMSDDLMVCVDIRLSLEIDAEIEETSKERFHGFHGVSVASTPEKVF
jgi:hypothetical protein